METYLIQIFSAAALSAVCELLSSFSFALRALDTDGITLVTGEKEWVCVCVCDACGLWKDILLFLYGGVYTAVVCGFWLCTSGDEIWRKNFWVFWDLFKQLMKKALDIF
jgi:hypothetical protein